MKATFARRGRHSTVEVDGVRVEQARRHEFRRLAKRYGWLHDEIGALGPQRERVAGDLWFKAGLRPNEMKRGETRTVTLKEA